LRPLAELPNRPRDVTFIRVVGPVSSRDLKNKLIDLRPKPWNLKTQLH
jgi:hypothetical protein